MAAVDAKDDRTLEQRLRLIEDRLEIYNLIASHPPSADTGAGGYTASVWTEDGAFDRGDEFSRPTGRAAIAGGSSNPEHHRAIEQRIAHFAGLPYVRITGDTCVRDLLFADPLCRSSCRTASARCSMSPITAHRAASTCIAFRPIAGSSCAPTTAGRSSVGPCARWTAPRRRARFCTARWSRKAAKPDSGVSPRPYIARPTASRARLTTGYA